MSSSKSNATFEGRKEETTIPLAGSEATTEKVEAQEGKTDTPPDGVPVATATATTDSAPTADEGHE